MSDAPAKPSPISSTATAAQVTAPALLDLALSEPACSQRNSYADVPETSDSYYTDPISHDQVFDTIYKLPVPDFKKIDHDFQHLPEAQRHQKMKLAAQEWWFSACNGNALHAVQRSSFSGDGSRQSSPFWCKQLSAAEVDSLFHEAGMLDSDMSSCHTLKRSRLATFSTSLC